MMILITQFPIRCRWRQFSRAGRCHQLHNQASHTCDDHHTQDYQGSHTANYDLIIIHMMMVRRVGGCKAFFGELLRLSVCRSIEHDGIQNHPTGSALTPAYTCTDTGWQNVVKCRTRKDPRFSATPAAQYLSWSLSHWVTSYFARPGETVQCEHIEGKQTFILNFAGSWFRCLI